MFNPQTLTKIKPITILTMESDSRAKFKNSGIKPISGQHFRKTHSVNYLHTAHVKKKKKIPTEASKPQLNTTTHNEAVVLSENVRCRLTAYIFQPLVPKVGSVCEIMCRKRGIGLQKQGTHCTRIRLEGRHSCHGACEYTHSHTHTYFWLCVYESQSLGCKPWPPLHLLQISQLKSDVWWRCMEGRGDDVTLKPELTCSLLSRWQLQAYTTIIPNSKGMNLMNYSICKVHIQARTGMWKFKLSQMCSLQYVIHQNTLVCVNLKIRVKVQGKHLSFPGQIQALYMWFFKIF